MKDIKQKSECDIQNVLNDLTRCIEDYDFEVTKTKR